MDLSKLKAPFESIKWRVQSFSKFKAQATCIPYIDARDVMNRLDEVVGPENWECDYKEVKGVMYCGIGVLIAVDNDYGRWVWKWDAGTETQVEKQKGEASDAFKRAFVKWGGARDLYEADMEYVPTNIKKEGTTYPYCVNESNQKIWNLTEFINKRIEARSGKPEWFGEAVRYLQTGGDISAITNGKYAGEFKKNPKLREQLENDII